MRIQFIPEYPFVRNLTVSLMGVPGVEVSAKPMAKVCPPVLFSPPPCPTIVLKHGAERLSLCGCTGPPERDGPPAHLDVHEDGDQGGYGRVRRSEVVDAEFAGYAQWACG